MPVPCRHLRPGAAGPPAHPRLSGPGVVRGTDRPLAGDGRDHRHRRQAGRRHRNRCERLPDCAGHLRGCGAADGLPAQRALDDPGRPLPRAHDRELRLAAAEGAVLRPVVPALDRAPRHPRAVPHCHRGGGLARRATVGEREEPRGARGADRPHGRAVPGPPGAARARDPELPARREADAARQRRLGQGAAGAADQGHLLRGRAHHRRGSGRWRRRAARSRRHRLRHGLQGERLPRRHRGVRPRGSGSCTIIGRAIRGLTTASPCPGSRTSS